MQEEWQEMEGEASESEETEEGSEDHDGEGEGEVTEGDGGNDDEDGPENGEGDEGVEGGEGGDEMLEMVGEEDGEQGAPQELAATPRGLEQELVVREVSREEVELVISGIGTLALIPTAPSSSPAYNCGRNSSQCERAIRLAPEVVGQSRLLSLLECVGADTRWHARNATAASRLGMHCGMSGDFPHALLPSRPHRAYRPPV